MQVHHNSPELYVVYLEEGERLRAAIEELAAKENITGAWLTAIGVLKKPELGYYRRKKMKYKHQKFKGCWEIGELGGNIALKDGKPFLHAHVTIGNRDFGSKTGHLFDARVGASVEMFIHTLDHPLIRTPHEPTGLALWDFNAVCPI